MSEEKIIQKDAAVTEPAVRMNMKQTAKGLWYGEATVRANTIKEATKMLDEAIAEINKRCSIGD